MSTRSCIARIGVHEGTFEGRYVHWDGSPSTRGPLLWGIIHGDFKGNVAKALAYLVDQHPAGWSSLEQRSCYCHPRRSRDPEFRCRKSEPAQLITHENIDSDIEWIYAFDAETSRLYIRDNRHAEDAGIVDLTGDPLTKDNWLKIECGENLERCSHYAWVHFPQLKGSNLSTQTFIGRRPFDLHDAVAFIIDGKRFKNTGSGGHSDYLRKMAGKHFPPSTWIATVATRNGRRADLPVAKIEGRNYIPYPGVVWVMPPTRDSENETFVGGA